MQLVFNMGRWRDFTGNKYFRIGVDSAACKIEGCDYKYKPKNGSEVHATPLIGHLTRKHLQHYLEAVKLEKKPKLITSSLVSYFKSQGASSLGVAIQPQPDATNIKFPVISQSIKNIAVEAVTSNGLPLSVFKKSGVAKMIAPMLVQLNLKLTTANVRTRTLNAAQQKKSEVKQTFAGKMVSVKVDLCTRRGRDFIGINFQAMVEGDLRVTIAAVTELHERATAAAIRENMVRCLLQLGISEKQIYSLTTDNGSNVFKVGELMRSDFALSEGENILDQDVENDCDENQISPSGLEIKNEIMTAEDGVITVRCAVHTLQLSVHDFFKANSNAREIVSKFRNVTKKCHKQSIRELFKQNNKPLSRLDCETRWSSTFLMLESMLYVGDLLDQIALANESLLFSNSEWVAIRELTESLKPVYEATIAIQLKKLTAGEFFGEWLKCSIQLQRSVSAISKAMLHAMEKRETALLLNAAFIAAIYVDPR